MIPSSELAATVLVRAAATKIPLPYVTDLQLAELGRVRAVQEIPSGEVAATVLVKTIATKSPLP